MNSHEKTVARRIIHIYDKLGANNRVNAVCIGMERGLLPTDLIARPSRLLEKKHNVACSLPTGLNCWNLHSDQSVESSSDTTASSANRSTSTNYAAAKAKPREIFVFGSNEAGIHGAGAALYAKNNHQAEWGVGRGLTGNSYALPTKSRGLKVRSLDIIRVDVQLFLAFAREHLDWKFNVTRIGCGLAGYTNEQIAPMFRGAPPNCHFDSEWEDYL